MIHFCFSLFSFCDLRFLFVCFFFVFVFFTKIYHQSSAIVVNWCRKPALNVDYTHIVFIWEKLLQAVCCTAVFDNEGRPTTVQAEKINQPPIRFDSNANPAYWPSVIRVCCSRVLLVPDSLGSH